MKVSHTSRILSVAAVGALALVMAAVPTAAEAGIGEMIQRVTQISEPIADALDQFAYVAGIAVLIVAGILIKGYSSQQDNNPKRMVGIAVCILAGVWLLYLPSTMKESGDTVYSSATSAGKGL